MSQPRERIQKLLARAGYGSRREIESWIDAGRITVNGTLAKPGEAVSSEDAICIDDKPISVRLAETLEHKTLIYHKPEGEVCSRHDEERRPTIFDNLPRLRVGRWINVGRLDINTSGLVIMTTDGELAHRLTHPSSEIEREYAVRVFGLTDIALIKRLRSGVELEDGLANFDYVSEAAGSGANKWFHVVLKEGRNREVRRLWEAIGCTVTRLMRVRFADVSMPKSLRPGRWEYATAKEIKSLYESVGLPLTESKIAESDKIKKAPLRTKMTRHRHNKTSTPYKRTDKS